MEAASFALIAHDLKNALGSLEGQLEALVDEPTPVMAQHALVQCAALRREFVHFLTVYGAANGLRAHCEDESPHEMLESLLRTARIRHLNLAQAPRVDLDIAENTPPFWYFDLRLVHMALEAAFHNASRFARGVIKLGVRQEEDFLVFAIEDDGAGLDAKDPSTTSTGLGTSLCHAVAQAHRCEERSGFIRLFNKPDGGACFELWLP